jgi:hypothetical protein
MKAKLRKVNMSTIYAPLNSVNTFRTVSTELPLDLDLTKDEKNELIELERLTATSSFTPVQLAKRFNVSTTKNVGIHYFCVEKNSSLLLLARNPHISPLLVFLIERKLTSTETVSAISTRCALLSNPAVLENPNLFKLLFGNLPDVTAANFLSVYNHTMEKANIDIFMFMLVKVGENASDTEKTLYSRYAERRKDEVYAWAEEFAPDFVDLPLSWILRAYGL